MSESRLPLRKLTITPDGAGSLRYQWFVVGSDIPVLDNTVFIGTGSLHFEQIPDYLVLRKDLNPDIFKDLIAAAVE
jgi:hypothetical protein